MTISTQAPRSSWRIIGWGTAAALLATPFVAMQFTNAVRWSPLDFLVMGALIGIVGLALEAGARLNRNTSYRAGLAVALLAVFLLIWANLAVGMIGNEGNAYNLVFAAVIAVAVGGACIARFRPRGMALAMVAAALTQLTIAAVGAMQDPRGAVFSTILASLWPIAAALFRRAAQQDAG